MSKMSRRISHGEVFQKAKDTAIEIAYELAKASYGPSAGTAAIENNYGYPTVSRDGVTNLRKLYLEDGDENMAARIVVQASEKSNKLVGDGTTAVVILSYHLYKEAMKLIGAGHNRMVVRKKLDETAIEVIEQIDKLKIECTPELARFVAKVSASDEAIGDMVADVIEKVGADGNIIVEEFDGIGSYSEEVDGFYWRKGFTNEFLIKNLSGLESRLNDIDIFITEKPLTTAGDIAPILNKIVERAGRGVELLIVGEVVDEALATLALNKVKGNIDTTLVDVPVHGPMRTLFLGDVAAITGGKIFPTGAKSSSFTIDMLGTAKKVVVNTYSTTIIEGGGAEEDIQMRVAELKQQLKEAEALIDKNELKKRISTILGKISIIRVGAATEVDRGEVQLRVEDAIAATQSALRDGIVPGGGTCLAKVRTDNFENAYEKPFQTLVENAGYNPEEGLFNIHNSKVEWAGYNLRKEFTIVNLLEEGIIDPAEVVKEAVRNATSVVGTLITTTVGITYIDREQKAD